MLGARGVGKSCYLLGMYGRMQMGVNGFSLHTKDFHKQQDLSNSLARLVHEDGGERYPRPVANAKEYLFDFCYGLKPLAEVKIDLPSSSFLSSGKFSSDEVQALIEQVKQSDCLFLCVSGEYLKQAVVKENGEVNLVLRQKVATKLGVRTTLKYIMELAEILNLTNSKPFPIAIVITKYDLCVKRGKDAIVQEIKNLFEPLFRPDSGWLVTICPVSLGKQLATDLDSGEIEPVNFQLPLLFAAFSFFRELCLRERHLCEDNENIKYLKLLILELQSLLLLKDGQEVETKVS